MKVKVDTLTMFIKQSYCMASKDYFYNILWCLFILFFWRFTACAHYLFTAFFFLCSMEIMVSHTELGMKWELVNNYNIFIFGNTPLIIRQVYIFHLKCNRWVFELWIWNSFSFFFFFSLGRTSWIISKSFLKKRCNWNVSLLARLWLQSAMWLCLYCSCSCSPRGTVIWSWERAVRCGNGLWRSNNYPFPCVTRKEEEMTCWDISPVEKCQESSSI